MSFLAFVITLSVLVLCHELGHFLLAKRLGVKVEEFGFGLPPRIASLKRGETTYSINALPIGGFVRLFGEEEAPSKTAKDAFMNKSKRARSAIVAAGVLMNLALATVAFSVIYLRIGIPVRTNQVIVSGIAKNSPAEMAGIKTEDRITKVDGAEVGGVKQFIESVKAKAGQTVEIELEGKGGASTAVKVIPRLDPPKGEGALGVAITETDLKFYPIWQMPFLALREGIKDSLSWAKTTIEVIFNMVFELVTKRVVPRDVAGFVGIYQVTGIVVKEGWLAMLKFLGVLSINLFVINLFPMPPLDGGKLLFIGIEAVFGKRLAPKVERWAQNVGMILLVILIVLITINDISRLFSKSLL